MFHQKEIKHTMLLALVFESLVIVCSFRPKSKLTADENMSSLLTLNNKFITKAKIYERKVREELFFVKFCLPEIGFI